MSTTTKIRPPKAPPERTSAPGEIATPPGTLAIERATLEWIAADAFTVDPSYDRPAHQDRINHMAENWKDEALGVVFASRRPDEEQLYLLDGQHRIGALRKQGRKADLVPTLVFEGLSVADEAELFVMMNKNRRALTPSELFKASLVEGNPGALEIQKVVDGLGLKLESLGASADPYAVKAVATVWRLYRAMGTSGLDATLSLALITWGDPPARNAFNQNIMLVLARVLYYGEGKIDVDRLRQVLAKEEPDAWLSRAASIRSLQGGDRNNVLQDVIISAYNKGLPSSKQLAGPGRGPSRKDPFTAATRFRRGGRKDGE